jgi:hypothetical protein
VGLEAKCQLRVGRTVHDGKALLETDEVIFRGPPDVRLKIPLTSITSISANNGALRIDHADGRAVLELGAAAEKWAERIRSPRTLIDKLDIKPDAVVSVLGASVSDDDFLKQLRTRTTRITIGRADPVSGVILLGIETARDLVRITKIATSMPRSAMLWVVHPKGVAGVKDTDIFAVADSAGLTYTKVARFSATHTAEKLVVPVGKR